MISSQIYQLLAPIIPTLTPTSYPNTCDQLLNGHLSLGLNISQLSTEGPSFTFESKPVDILDQTHTESFADSLQLKDFIPPIPFDVDQQLSDSIISSLFAQKKQELLNSPQQLKEMEKVVMSLVQNNKITIGDFSENCLVSSNKYTHEGEVLQIGYMQVPIQNKRYTSDDVFNKMPHPIRLKKKKRVIKQERVEPKSKEQILIEFQLLADMFNIDLNQKEDKNYQKVLDVIDFKDTTYDILWQDILSKIGVRKTEEKQGNKKLMEDQGVDDEFMQTVNKIIQQHQQQEKQLDLELQPEKMEDEAEDQEEEKETNVAEEEQLTDTFKTIKITSLANNPLKTNQYKYAIQDQTDLLNFYDMLPKQKFAMHYPFELDQFQKRSILHLEKKESVFVCAHTSAGKTVVAEYGIALAIKHKRKVIYTSPIKALSNQKYRQFSEKFQSVGIVTGDISLNQEANCVIMTTQILAKQLYKGADMIRDIEWVIFDQVHYINNQERGVVWEETIIMLPEHIGIIMLSATVPNYMEFADWVGRTKRRTIFVMKTFHRPVPLEHSLYIFDKFHVIKEANGNFLIDEYSEMLKQIHRLNLTQEQLKEQKKADKKKKIEERGFWNDNRRQQAVKKATQKAVNKFIKNVSQDDMKRHKDRENNRVVSQLIADCKQKKLLPCVIFCFSKKKIHELAENIYTTQLNTNKEAGQVHHFFMDAMKNLKPEDKELNQFRFIYQIAKNGYAIHHGDLMPLAKQIVELLFSKGLIKVLIATQTFAMGINMPTKTVIFHSTKKVDGPDGAMRFLNSSEYVQMSGRAGRRGLDQKGTVIIIVKDPQSLPKPDEMIKMTDHPGEPLVSKFRITYKSMLNLFSSKDINTEEMIRQSFYENPKFSNLNSNHERIRSLKKQYDKLSEIQCPFNKLQTRLLIEEYMKAVDESRSFNQVQFSDFERTKTMLPKYGMIIDHSNQLHKCVVLRVDKTINNVKPVQILTINQISTQLYFTKKQMDESDQPKRKKIVLEYEKGDKIETGAVPETKNKFHYYVRWIKPTELVDIYSLKIMNEKNIQFSRQVYEELAKKLMEIPEKLTSVFKDEEYLTDKRKVFNQVVQSKCHDCQFKVKHTLQNTRRRKVKQELKWLLSKVDKNQLGMLRDYKDMILLLEELQFVNKSSILLKGKIARQVDIYVTEILVEGVLEPLKQQEIAALLSAFVNQYKPRNPKPSKANENKKQHPANSPFHPNHIYTPALTQAMQRTYEIVKKIAAIQSKYYDLADLNEEERIINTINFYLVQPIYEWTIGADFIDISDPIEAPEGALIKTIMRLDILLRNLKSGCMIVGNTQLAEKIQRTSETIKRGIVFTQSLYLAE